MVQDKAKDVFREVVKCAGYSFKELKGNSRKREAVDKRIAVSCVMFDMGICCADIARMLGRTKGIPQKLYLPLRPYVKDEVKRIKEKLNVDA